MIRDFASIFYKVIVVVAVMGKRFLSVELVQVEISHHFLFFDWKSLFLESEVNDVFKIKFICGMKGACLRE